MRVRRFAFVTLFLLAAPVRAATAPAFDGAFWQHWGDGKAELDGYILTQPRYGQLRKGTLVLIFVTETFSRSAHVKADPGKHPPSDELAVMKLNVVKGFQTGIYDYDLMTSAFIALADGPGCPAGTPTKISFSGQEWCGQVFHELLFSEAGIDETLHSYFDGEGDARRSLPSKVAALCGDAVLLWARGLAAPVLAPGESTDVPFLPSLESSRLGHRPLAWGVATLSRLPGTSNVTVPAGTFTVSTYTVKSPDRLITLKVEAAEPRRIVSWESSDGEKAELAGTDRTKYWELHDEGDERELRKLGLAPPSMRSPR